MYPFLSAATDCIFNTKRKFKLCWDEKLDRHKVIERLPLYCPPQFHISNPRCIADLELYAYRKLFIDRVGEHVVAKKLANYYKQIMHEEADDVIVLLWNRILWRVQKVIMRLKYIMLYDKELAKKLNIRKIMTNKSLSYIRRFKSFENLDSNFKMLRHIGRYIFPILRQAGDNFMEYRLDTIGVMIIRFESIMH